MAVAGALLLILIAIILFHWWSPWWMPEQASNWHVFDKAFDVSLWITGAVFVAINLFLIFTVWRYRATKSAAHSTSDRLTPGKKTEWTLIIVTSVGIIIMLAPGLWLYAVYVSHPKPDLKLEVMGQQWHWSFRLPGDDGELGATLPSLISIENPFGLRKDDPAGADDVIIDGPYLQLPYGKTVDVVLRTKDVLHSFYVPEFRIKMDLVPGRVTSVWLKTEKLGDFPILCTEYCGLAHARMRGQISVVSEAEFEQWLAEQARFSKQKHAHQGLQQHRTGT